MHLHPRVNDPEIIVCRCFAYWQSNSESVRNWDLRTLPCAYYFDLIRINRVSTAEMSIEERLPPNYGKLDVALRSIGYSFEVAVADVIDNSIDAQAKNVLVRLINTGDGHLDLAIWDDGCGMGEKTLKEAMRFGADVSQEIERLGKFGLGLKLASL